jgi:hypothetical protein
MDAQKDKPQIDAEMKEGQALGVSGDAGRLCERPQVLPAPIPWRRSRRSSTRS